MKGDVAMGFVCFRIDGVGFRRFRVCRRFCLNRDSWDWRGILGILLLRCRGIALGWGVLAPPFRPGHPHPGPLPPSGRGDVFLVGDGFG